MNLEISSTVPAQNPPAVIFWFKVYAGVMTAIFALCVLAGPFLIWIGAQAKTEETGEFILQGVWLCIVGLPLAIAYAMPFFCRENHGFGFMV